MGTNEILERYGVGFRAPLWNGEDALERRFVKAWGGSHGSVWCILKRAYGEPHRHFHRLRHIGECLQVVEQYAAIVGWERIPKELELALWFHDLVYEPGATDNERRSADIFEALANEAGLSPDVVKGATALILETQKHEARTVLLSSIMCDSDLWILGSSPTRYRQYAQQVRREFERYSNWKYRWGRSRFLRGTLRKKSIYTNPLFEEAFGARSRMNMQRELGHLRRGGPRGDHDYWKVIPETHSFT